MAGRDKSPEDPDWAPQLPSIWDEPGEEREEAWFDGELESGGDPFAPPGPMAVREPEWIDPQAWIEAEREAGRVLAGAAEAVGRLDERLRRCPASIRLAWRERLALEEVSSLLWAEGVRFRPETLALANAGRVSRTEEEGSVVTQALWARRRLLGEGSLSSDPDALATFLGRVRVAALPVAWEELPETLLPTGPSPAAISEWCRAMTMLAAKPGGTHGLTRCAAAFHLWRALGLSSADAWLEPGVIAARAGAEEARGGISAVPLSAGSPRALIGGNDALARLEAWLSGLLRAANHAQMRLDRIEAWQVRAMSGCDLKGKAGPALIELLAARPILSARDVAGELGVSTVQARTLMNRLTAQGLATELTGQSRFRFWQAAA